MAGLGEGTVLCPLRVDGGGNVPGPSSNIGKVNRYGPLRLEHGPAVAQFSQLSLNGLTPIGEFVLPLRSPVLGVGLLSTLSSICKWCGSARFARPTRNGLADVAMVRTAAVA
jgi:hypothetical protein